MMKKKVILVLLVLIIVAVFCYAGASWWKTRQAQIKMGIASDKFPYRLYTQEELNRMYPQIKNADVPTRTTPEQTYANFREALRMNNLDMAIEQLSKDSEKYEENKKTLEEAYDSGKFISGLSDYPEKTERSNFGDSIGSLCYEQADDTNKISACTSFIKDSNGDWKIDRL
jgi:flagellar basal body-associated protein FliL